MRPIPTGTSRRKELSCRNANVGRNYRRQHGTRSTAPNSHGTRNDHDINRSQRIRLYRRTTSRQYNSSKICPSNHGHRRQRIRRSSRLPKDASVSHGRYLRTLSQSRFGHGGQRRPNKHGSTSLNHNNKGASSYSNSHAPSNNKKATYILTTSRHHPSRTMDQRHSRGHLLRPRYKRNIRNRGRPTRQSSIRSRRHGTPSIN